MTDDSRKTASAPDALVAALVGDLAPVEPVRLARTIAVAVVLEVALVAITAWMFGVRVKATERLADPMFTALLVLLAAGVTASAVTMARLAIPGRAVGAGVRMAVVGLPLVVALVVIALSPWGGTWKGFSAVLLEGLHCTHNTLLVATPAWLAGLFYLRRLAPLDPLGVGLFSACTALLTAAFAVQMSCPSCDSWHLAMSHYAPIVLAAGVAALLSLPILRIHR